MTQVLIVEDVNAQACERLLNMSRSAFHVLVVDKHAEMVSEKAKDEAVSETFLKSIPSIAMRLSILRTAANVSREPAGAFRSAVLEFDRTAIIVLPRGEYTFGVAVLKEDATPELIAKAKAILKQPAEL